LTPPLALKPVPDADTEVSVKLAFPLFVISIVCELLVPTDTVPKFKLVALGVSARIVEDPLALRLITIGADPAELVIEMLPVCPPEAVGLNEAEKFVLSPGSSVVGIDRPDCLKPVPDAEIPVIVRSVVPLFVMRMVCESVVPTVTVPKLTLDGTTSITPLGWPFPAGLPGFVTHAVIANIAASTRNKGRICRCVLPQRADGISEADVCEPPGICTPLMTVLDC